MRAPFAFLALAALILSGCGPQPAATPNAAQAAAANAPAPVPADATAIRGQVSIEGLSDLPRGLELRLRLLDMSDPSIAPPVVAERVEPAPSSLPYRYALPFDAGKITEDRRYGIEANLQTGGVALYGSPKPATVLTQGAGREANLVLTRGSVAAADIAPADQLNQEFEALEGSIGGLRRLVGERINADVTIGWDAFADGADVRFARENVDYGAAGSASFRFAYKDGQPWVIARDQGGVLSLVGWDADGQLVLNRHADGGQLDEAAIEELREQAARLHAIVKPRAARD